MAQPTAGEKAVLLSALSDQREHVLGILDGLSTEALRQPVLPSGWTCVGLVNHLALDVERFWFRMIVAGEGAGEDADEDGDSAWQVGPETPPEAVFELYHQEIANANAIIATSQPDSPPAWWPEDLWPTWRLHDVREIMLHVISETACHAGHLDAARELLDGRKWLVLT